MWSRADAAAVPGSSSSITGEGKQPGLSAFVQMSGGGMKRDGSAELAAAEVEEAERPSPGEM